MKLLSLALLLSLMSQAADYSARTVTIDGLLVLQLADVRHKAEVSIVPSMGNIAYEFKVNGKNAFWVPFQSLRELKANPSLCGVPFLAPWANRLDQDAFYANGKKFPLNTELGNLRRDQNQKPIHGLLAFSPEWKVVKVESDDRAAWTTSRLEFWRIPGVDVAISIRPHDRDDLPAPKWGTGSRNIASEPFDGSNAGWDWIPSLLPDPRRPSRSVEGTPGSSRTRTTFQDADPDG